MYASHALNSVQIASIVERVREEGERNGKRERGKEEEEREEGGERGREEEGRRNEKRERRGEERARRRREEVCHACLTIKLRCLLYIHKSN